MQCNRYWFAHPGVNVVLFLLPPFSLEINELQFLFTLTLSSLQMLLLAFWNDNCTSKSWTLLEYRKKKICTKVFCQSIWRKSLNVVHKLTCFSYIIYLLIHLLVYLLTFSHIYHAVFWTVSFTPRTIPIQVNGDKNVKQGNLLGAREKIWWLLLPAVSGHSIHPLRVSG